MARSEEAIQRRALKRQRTEEEQRGADRKDMAQAKLRQSRMNRADSSTTRLHPESGSQNFPPDERLDEVGAWKCPQCGNHNFASRNWCHSKTCDQRRPSDIPRPPRSNNSEYTSAYSKPSRHDPETSKKLVWAKQADQSTLSTNQQLRKRYKDTGGEGMSAEDVERAKLLIARDERKREKKRKLQEEAVAGDTLSPVLPVEEEKPADAKPPISNEGKQKSSSSKAQKDKNKALLARYEKTGGAGMAEDQVERAKKLIARAERKREKRTRLGQEQTESSSKKAKSQ